jgi:gluconolactonase
MTLPNWGAFAPDGSYYVTDSGSWKGSDGRVYVVRRGRTSLWTDECVEFPNGLAVTPDGGELWVLESTPGRLVAFDIRSDGSAGPMRVLLDLTGHVPDGIAFAGDGSILITCYRPDVVLRWQPGSRPEVVAEDPEGTVLAAPTNCAFIGPDLATVAVPNIGRWHITRFTIPGVTGAPLFYPTSDELGS